MEVPVKISFDPDNERDMAIYKMGMFNTFGEFLAETTSHSLLAITGNPLIKKEIEFTEDGQEQDIDFTFNSFQVLYEIKNKSSKFFLVINILDGDNVYTFLYFQNKIFSLIKPSSMKYKLSLDVRIERIDFDIVYASLKITFKNSSSLLDSLTLPIPKTFLTGIPTATPTDMLFKTMQPKKFTVYIYCI